MNHISHEQSRVSHRCGWWLPFVLVCGALVGGGVGRAADDAVENARDVATRALLDQLEERQMSDVVLWVLERIEKDGEASPSLKQEVPFRRATALVGTSRTETDSTKRAAIFDAADKEIDAFLKGKPTGAQAINAYTQKGNLLIQRGRAKVEQSKAPGQDAKKLLAEAVPFFDSAIAALQGTIKPKDEIKDDRVINNAEDAVIQSLRKVDEELKAVKGDKPAEDAPKSRKPPPRRTAATEQRLEQLEEQQEQLRQKLVQTRLMVASAH
ncbi:MAG: hypothetical protein ACKOD2_19255, partial [Ilumatobacteraceae bacterium]